jgi:hypothetical protein
MVLEDRFEWIRRVSDQLVTMTSLTKKDTTKLQRINSRLRELTGDYVKTSVDVDNPGGGVEENRLRRKKWIHDPENKVTFYQSLPQSFCCTTTELTVV